MDYMDNDTRAAYNLQRLTKLLSRAAAAFPDAEIAPVVEASLGYCSTQVRFRNGLEVMVATDSGLPDALFEVVRFQQANRRRRLGFETGNTFGAAFSDKLTSELVLTLLGEYSRLPSIAAS